MTGDYTVSPTPLFTQQATRNAIGLIPFSVPTTTLPPGRYFLCVNQLSDENLAVAFDANPAHTSYWKTDNNVSPMSAGLQGLAIRMLLGSPPANDAAIRAITAPENGININLTATEQIKATIQNYGTNPIATAQMVLTVDGATPITETFTGNIASGAIADYTFAQTVDLSAAGDHTIKVEVISANDFSDANNSKTITVHNVICSDGAVILPLVQNFEDDSYWCWTTITYYPPNDLGGTSEHPMGVYYYDDTMSKEFSFSSTDWIFINDFNQYLITPELSDNNGLKVTFDYRAPSGCGEAFKVGYSSTTNDLASFTWGEEYYTYMPDISQFVGIAPAGTKYIAINYYGNWCGLAVDNIVIDELPENDALITAITAPVDGVNLTTTEQITATIVNYGSTPITTAQMKLTVDGGTPITETFTEYNIGAAGDSAEYTFTARADLSAAGEHTITVEIILTGDANVADNSHTITVKNVICGNVTLPLTEDFEDDSYWCWTTISDSEIYGHGGIDDSFLGVRYDETSTSMVFQFNPCYCELVNYNQYLISPELPTNNGIKITGDWRITTPFVQYCKVGYSTTTNDIASFTWGEEIACSSMDMNHFLDVVPAGTKYIAISFDSNSGYGFYFDNIVIEELPANDATITSITEPVSGVNLTTTERVNATIRNLGSNPIITAQMKLTIDGGAPITETFTGNITTGNTANYEFTTPVDLSVAEYHNIIVEVVLTGDANAENNSQTITIYNQICGDVILPLVENFNGYSHWCWTSFSNNEENGIGVYYDDIMGTICAFSSNNYVEDGDYNQYLISPELPINDNGLKVTFDHRSPNWNPYNPSNEYFKVGYSTTTNDISAFIWGEENVTANAETTAQFLGYVPSGTKYIAINYYNNYFTYSNILLIDNIVIEELLENDAAITAITVPVSGVHVNLTATEQVTATVANVGNNPIINAQMRLTIDGGAPIIEQLSVDNAILTGYNSNFLFAGTVDLSAPGSHTIKVEVVLEGDENAENNSQTITVSNVICNAVATLPLVEDFQDDSYWCWTRISDNIENGPGGTCGNIMDVYNNGTNREFVFSSYCYAESGNYSQYLISPQLPTNNGLMVTFNYRSPFISDELFKIGYSTTTNDFIAFTWGEENIANSADMTQFSTIVPAGTKYIAIVYFNIYSMYMLAVDDIVIDVITGVPSVNGNKINIRQNNSEVLIDVSENSDVRVIDMYGRVLGSYKAIANSTLTVTQPAGIYLFEIRSDSGVSTHKLLVR